MSNRLAAAGFARVDIAAWAPAPSPWQRLAAAVRGWLRPLPAGLSAHLQRDLGLAPSSATPALLLDGEARRLGF